MINNRLRLNRYRLRKDNIFLTFRAPDGGDKGT